MKLAFQLATVVGLGAFAVLAVDFAFTVHRERAVIEAEMRADHERLLGLIAPQVEVALVNAGVDGARAAVPRVPDPSVWLSVEPRREATRLEGWLVSRRPLGSSGFDLVAAESTVSEEAFLTGSLVQRGLTSLAIAVVIALLAWRFSTRVVSRRVEGLVQQLRDVGAGRDPGPLPAMGRDELATLARETNAMTLELRATREALEEEHQARLRAVEQLRHADRLTTVGRLATGLAHELGTPLSVIAIKADRLREDERASPGMKAQALVIRDRVEFIRTLVRRVLQFGRPLPPMRRHVDLEALARDVVAMVTPLATKRGVTVHVHSVEPAVCLPVDPHQLEQVFSNLLVNAFLASAPGQRVTLALGRTRREVGGVAVDCVLVTVRDEGVGMSDDVRAHVFEPFFTTRAVGEGTGLGLSVCWGIARDHGGWLEVESAPGKGSTFSLVLPSVPPEEVTRESTSHAARAAAATAG
ncbi:MAG: ATP-binding protein [Myxococcaceae bacterium]|nr:ATP-binding protein [Myxococcaceae bacterium]